MKKVCFKSANSVGHFELPDDAVIVDNDDNEEMEEGMYPVGLKMEGDNDENGRDIRDDDDNTLPLDRDSIFISKDEGEGMFPEGVR